MAAQQAWHGTRKCAVNGAKIPRYAQAAGVKCPFCLNIQGAAIGTRKTPPLETQLDKLQKLHDDGVITEDELGERRAAAIDKAVVKPTPPQASPVPASTLYRTPSPSLFESLKKNRVPVGAVAIGVIVLLVIAWVGGAGGDTASSSVATQSATREVEGTLLGDAWIGAGSYTLHAAAKAYNAAGDFTAYAARISAPGADDLCLYWYAGGRNFGDGLTLGDTVTREFSDWGSLASADSPAASTVRASAATPEGRAVIAKVGC